MPMPSLTGTRLRERRIALGLRQADLAAEVGVSASYLNLIEYNRRRISDALLARLAEALGQPVAAFQDGIGGAVLEDLRAAAARMPGGEVDRAEEFAGRYPGWAATVIGFSQRVASLERALEAVNDRMNHDPHLSSSLHEVLSAVASVRSTAGILADTEDIEPEWRARFLANLNDDSKRLALGADALVRYLDSAGPAEDQGLATPQEDVEAWLAASGWQLGQEVPALASAAARDMAAVLVAQGNRDRALLPDAEFARALAEEGPDPMRLAARFGVDVLTVFRRIALRADSEAGLVICDASGTLTFRKPARGFALPRFGAACPLWPLFAALGHAMMPIETVVETAGAEPMRFRMRGFCQPRFPAGFGGPELREAAMLILPEPRGPEQALPVGSSCRVCQRATCAGRREPSIMSV